MWDLISIHEMRRRAPLHYEVKADNARFSAYLLWKMSNDDNQKLAAELGYAGTPRGALIEAFRREAAIALELMIKAVIAQRIESGIAKANIDKVKPTHNLPKLWNDASLPELDSDGKRTLLIAKRVLFWSGRYAAPKRDSDFIKDQAEFDQLKSEPSSAQNDLLRFGLFNWSDIDKVYRVAAGSFWALRQ
ncbi:MAG: hypothetical protein U1E81_15210 [Xanthobacteraceae bacterium]